MTSLEELEKDWDKASKAYTGKAYMSAINIMKGVSISAYPNGRTRYLRSFQRYHQNASTTAKWKKHPDTNPPANMNVSMMRTAKGSRASTGFLISVFSAKQFLTAFIRTTGHYLIQGNRNGGRRTNLHRYATPVNEGFFSTWTDAVENKFIQSLDKIDLI